MRPDIRKEKKGNRENIEPAMPEDKKGLLRPVGHAIRYDKMAQFQT
jgi:hypothetical protein